jgi:hypothetical protein
MIEVHKPLSTAGYKFYVIVFYLLSAMLYVSVAICVWVAWCFKNDSFPYLWPIKFVRVVASLFFGMLYIAALNIFLVIIECAPEHGVWYQHVWHKRESSVVLGAGAPGPARLRRGEGPRVWAQRLRRHMAGWVRDWIAVWHHAAWGRLRTGAPTALAQARRRHFITCMSLSC